MSKMNLKGVFLGGLVAGIVFLVFGMASYFLYLANEWKPVMDDLGAPINETAGMYVFGIIFCFIVGIVAVWLYAAIRPRFGAGPKTAFLAGFVFWILSGLFAYITFGMTGLFPVNLLIIDCLIYLVTVIVATLLGAWVYREETPQSG